MIDALLANIRAKPFAGNRRVVALVGPPASGKSTLAEALAARDPTLQVVPMDGFHLDNSVLAERGMLARKGAPDSFDVFGFLHLIRRLKVEDNVVFPRFDRTLDRSIAGAGVIGADTGTILVEGNYLMLDAPHWRDLCPLWDMTVKIDVSLAVLEQRLLQRWAGYGYGQQDALEKVEGNDLPNARYVMQNSLPCDVVVDTDQVLDGGPPVSAPTDEVE